MFNHVFNYVFNDVSHDMPCHVMTTWSQMGGCGAHRRAARSQVRTVHVPWLDDRPGEGEHAAEVRQRRVRPVSRK